MSNPTIAEQITALESELALVKAQQAAASAGGQSFTVDGMSVYNVQYAALRERRISIEKSLQRLYRGGRGFIIDMSHPGTDSAETDNTVFTRVQA